MRRYALTLALLLTLLPPASAHAQPETACFAQTGRCISGRFLEYWRAGGGLALFGLPISDVLWEDGRNVQYFERNRFEQHVEHAPPYDVLLARFGAERFAAAGRDWQAQPPGRPSPDCLFFAETQHALCGRFRQVWEERGGLAVFGFPLTEEFAERNEADGRTYTVQYFERNRFEYHAENADPYDVLLGLLGNWRTGWLLGETRDAAAVQATISSPVGTASPLTTVPLTVSAPGYSGPATLQIFDGAGRRFASLPLTLVDGRVSASLTTGGALGPHAATLLIGGKIAGIANTLYTLDAQTSLSTGVADIDALYPLTHSLQDQSVSEYVIDGYKLRGYRSPDSDLIWLRDHVHQARGYRYFERDVTSALDAFRRFQQPNGSLDDFLGNPPWGLIRGRMDVEADVEYLYALGVYQAWQASGDDAWLRQSLPAAERAIGYSTSDPQRWEPNLRMIKRPLTVDTWDYEYGGPDYTVDGKAIGRHRIDERTIWGIMHGDNSGMAESMNRLADVFAYLGDQGKAASYRARAADLTAQLNALCWNGSFYRHRLPLTAFRVPGVDEDKQLSLSNAFALNRGVLDSTQATAILNEYQYRRIANPAVFAEWYSIDPPFPANSFGTGATWGDTPGTYTNGGVLPLVGGELARGAFHWGQPGYGFDILGRYRFMLQRQGGGYLWYYPQGNPGISGKETVAHDGWGASAMLAALFEGAAGVVDNAALLKDVTLSPAWAADKRVTTADVTVRYPASFGYLSYRWERQADALRLTVSGTLERGKARLLLPDKADAPRRVVVNGAAVPVQVEELGKSRYVVVELQPGVTVIVMA